jgi:hypothetical protein
MEDKVALLRAVAEAIGVNLDEVFGKKSVDAEALAL